MRILLVDADDLAWRAALRIAREGVAGPEVSAALERDLSRRIDEARALYAAEQTVLALSDGANWRRLVWPAYKAHRAARPRPAALGAARALLRERWAARQAPGLEADDLLGLMATGGALDFGAPPAARQADRQADLKAGEQADPEAGRMAAPALADGEPPAPLERAEIEPARLAALRQERLGLGALSGVPSDDLSCAPSGVWSAAPPAGFGPERVVLSRDKDLMTIPCRLAQRCGGVREISADEADRRHALQTLTGDAADGYPGCPGLGPIKAERRLAAAPPTPQGRWGAVAEAYRAAGLPLAEALAQARIARVLRRGELDGAGRPILFDPPWRL